MGKAQFRIVDKDAPDYNPYGTVYTARQRQILAGYIPPEDAKLNELNILMHKAQMNMDFCSYEIAQHLYYRKVRADEYFPSLSIEESKAILQSLTPWKIRWNR